MVHVRVLRITPPRIPTPNLLGIARVSLQLEDGEITIDDLRILKNAQGELWLGMPSVRVRDASGGSGYVPIVLFDTRLKRLVEDAVLAAWRAQ